MRNQMKKSMTDRAISLAMSKLQKLSQGDNEVAIQILEQSIFRNWIGLFPLNDDIRHQGMAVLKSSVTI